MKRLYVQLKSKIDIIPFFEKKENPFVNTVIAGWEIKFLCFSINYKNGK